MGGCGLDLTGQEYDPVMGSCKHDNEPSGSKEKGGKCRPAEFRSAFEGLLLDGVTVYGTGC